MKALIIGAAGFVGHYLIEHLASIGKEVIATHLPGETIDAQATTVELDILDPTACVNMMETVQPCEVYHLAAQSSVAVAWQHPALTVDINIKGTINILESIRGKNIRLLLVGSSEEYGVVPPECMPISENLRTNPQNIYAVSKATQNTLGEVYKNAYDLDVIMTRSFNHIGPRQTEKFVVSSFCKQVADIEAGFCSPTIKVGNLSARRDFTDVRDIVRAYGLLMKKGKSGETYNVGSGKAVSIQSILDSLLEMSSQKIMVEQDPTRMRPSDVPVIVADISKLHAETSWQPEILISETIRNVLDHWRSKV